MEMRMPTVSAPAGHLCGRHASDHAGLDPAIHPMPRPPLFRILHPVQQLREIIVTTVTRGKRKHHNPIALRPRPSEELVHLIAARLGNTSTAAWARPDRAAGLQALVMHPVALSVAIRRGHHIDARAFRDHGPPAETHPSLTTKELRRMSLMPETVAPTLRVANGFRSNTKEGFAAGLRRLHRARISTPSAVERRMCKSVVFTPATGRKCHRRASSGRRPSCLCRGNTLFLSLSSGFGPVIPWASLRCWVAKLRTAGFAR